MAEKSPEDCADVSRPRDVDAILKIRAILAEIPPETRMAVLQFLMSTLNGSADMFSAYSAQKQQAAGLGRIVGYAGR